MRALGWQPDSNVALPQQQTEVIRDGHRARGIREAFQ
jgi:hypothetical protein